MDTLHQLQDDAYRKVFFCLAQGVYTLEKESVLTILREELQVSPERHKELSEEVSRKRREAASAQTHYEAPQRNQPYHRANSNHHAPSSSYHAAAAEHQNGGYGNGYADGYGTDISDDSPMAKKGSRKPQPPVKQEGRRRLKKQEDAAQGLGGRAAGRQPAAAQQSLAAGDMPIDRLIGYKVQRYWPGDGWYDGVITDYKNESEEHCIVYDIGRETESYEWYDVQNASPAECHVTDEICVPLPVQQTNPGHASAQAPSKQMHRKPGAAAVGYR